MEVIMKITNMKCNHISNPLGFKMDSVVLSWITECSTADFQTAARIEISKSEDFSTAIFDSGKDENADSICYIVTIKLQPRTRYYWRVTVWAGGESATSDISWFETAKMEEPWQAKWITPSDDSGSNPLFRKTFSIPSNKKIAKARAYAAAAGVYELEVNGRKAGNEFLAPFCNQYTQWIQYQTYDITEFLVPGNNAIGALVGEGWYRGRFGLEGGKTNTFGDKPGFLCEVIIDYEDGTSDIIMTDTSWQTAPCCIVESSIYDGEKQDARMIIDGWSCAGPSQKNHAGEIVEWKQAVLLDMDMSLLTARLSIPVVIKETMKPKEVIVTPAGEIVLDMGQNMVGGFFLDVDLPAGSYLTLQFGEILQDGNFYQGNLRTAKQTFTYISDGKPSTIRQYFTFFGYRYVKVSGWTENKEYLMDKYTGTVIYSDMERTGCIETSNPKVNQLISNALWGQKGNFVDVPTDCPQRDERMGWTGDAQVFCGTASFNMDTYAFFRKYLYDMAKEQFINNGKVPVVVPCIFDSREQSSAWSDATTIIPWTCYLFTGDPTILKEHFPAMKAYVESIRAEDIEKRNLWMPSFSFGDWLALDNPDPYAYYGGTPIDLISSAYYYYSTRIVEKAAKVLGYEEDALEYGKLADDIRTAYQKEFITETGRMAVDTQTAVIVTLFMDLAPEQHRKRIIDHLYEMLKKNNFYLKTGFVGTPYICRVLSENGYNDVAYRLLLNEEIPSWLYCVNLSATTIWERWNSVLPNGQMGDQGMNSLNHYAYGSIVEWMYRNMCGINPVEDCPGFRKVRIAPMPDVRIRSAKAMFRSPVGVYESAWEIREDGSLKVTVTVPFGGTAELVLPDSNGKPKILKRGTYCFEYMPNRKYEFHYSTYNSTISELLDNPETAGIVEKFLPGITELMNQRKMGTLRKGMFRDLAGNLEFRRYSKEALDRLDKALYDLKVNF
jgi:alpha-L-rhamnosidase